MKKKAASKEPVTKDDLSKALSNYPTKKDLENVLKNYPTKKETKNIVEEALTNYPTKWDMDKRFDVQDRKWDERFTNLKSDIFTRFDELMGELAQQREDRLFTDNDVKVLKDKSDEHEKRIKKLEATQPSA